ncbi:MAG: hypothetical protein ACYDBB_24020 [Armatimonadota bacterium]
MTNNFNKDDEEFIDEIPEIDDETMEAAFICEIDDAVHKRLLGTPWEEKALHIANNETPFEERVAFYQELRKANALPEDAGYFLIAWSIAKIADERICQFYESAFASRYAKVLDQYGVDEDVEEVWDLEGGPPEYEALNAEFNKAADALNLATYQSFGEHQMGKDCCSADAQERYDAGYEELVGVGEFLESQDE